jgi:uncharacterized membrane protein
MSSKIFLRIAAIVMLLHCVGHTIGVATWQNPDGEIPIEVVQKMQDVQFNFMGKDGSTMAEFYTGFGYCGTILMLFIAVLLWIFSGRKDKSVTKELWVTGLAIVLLAVIEIIYFFPFAVAFCVISAVLVFISIFFINKMKENNYTEK